MHRVSGLLLITTACQLSEYTPPVQRLEFEDDGGNAGGDTSGDPTAGDPHAGDAAGDPTPGDTFAGDPTLLDVGTPCQDDVQCSLGFCTNGVCCDMRCQGTCATCAASGACQAPADDPACGTIECDGLDALPCRDFHDLTADRCAARGACKQPDSADCDQWTDAAAGTPCDDGDACTDPDRCGGGTCSGDSVCTAVTDITTAADINDIDSGANILAYGMSWADIDNDGDLDLWTSRGADLFVNNGNGTFTRTAGPWDAALYCRTGGWADVDNDGDLDLALRRSTSTAWHQLLINDGSGVFTDRGVAAGISDSYNVGGTLWIDFDHDGDIDLFHPESYDAADNPTPQMRMFSNNGDLPVTFTLIDDTTTGLAFPAADEYLGEAAAVADVNNDGHPDIWFSDHQTGRLYLNDGDGTFTEDAAGAGLALDMGTSQPYYAVLFADYDNDGWVDAFFGHPDLTANRLYHNDGDGTFTLTALMAEDLGDSRAAAWGDIDNDGDIDLLIANEGTADVLYENDGGTFTNIAGSLGVDGSATGVSVGASFADYDNDGDLDMLLFSGVDGENAMWQNDTDDNKYLKVITTGRGAGHASLDGIGSRVELLDATGTTLHTIREVSGGEGLGGQPARVLHFGLAAAWGGAHATYTVRVHFVDGTTAETTVVPAQASLDFGGNSVPQTIEIVQP